MQITAEQLLREAKERELEIVARVSRNEFYELAHILRIRHIEGLIVDSVFSNAFSVRLDFIFASHVLYSTVIT